MSNLILKIKSILRPLHFGLSFGIILIIFEIKLRIAFGTGKTNFFSTLDKFHSCLINSLLKKFSISFEQEFETEIKDNTSYLFVSNHQSNFDICILYYFLKPAQLTFVAKEELGRFIPTVSFVLKHDGSAIIHRDNPKQAITEIKKLGKRLEASKESQPILSAAICPEGTRSKTGKLSVYQTAGLKTILKHAPNAKIIPVYLSGPGKMIANFKSLNYTGQVVKIKVGKELDTDSFKNIGELAKKIESWAKKQEEFYS